MTPSDRQQTEGKPMTENKKDEIKKGIVEKFKAHRKVPKHENPDSKENSKKYHTGKTCVTHLCFKPAGTAWSDHWCWECNRDRLNRITEQMERLLK